MTEELEAESDHVSTAADSGDVLAAKEIVRFMYRHYDIFLILLTKSQGSRYEDLVSCFADRGEAHYKMLSSQMAEKLGIPEPDSYLIHWITHMQINAFTHLLIHETDIGKDLSDRNRIVEKNVKKCCKKY